jgi:ParB/RepB/Spo0J family partition protein
LRVEEIPIKDIIIPEQRARATFTDEQFQELKASIEKNGFTIPILVRQLDNGKYELIDGEHRIQVVKELGWEKIPAVISELDDTKATLLNILANTARGTQNPMDVAEALRRAYDAGADIKELAAATGHTESWVKLYLTLTELPDHYKEALRNGQLKVGHVQEAMRLMDPIEIDAALQSALQLGWNVKVLKYYVDQRLADLQRAQEAGDKEFLETPPTPQYAEQLVMYGDCMTCKRKVNRNDLYMPTICADCRALLEWIVEQLGNPKEAMQTIYNALSLYFDVTRREKMQAMQVQQQPQQQQVMTSSNNGQTATQQVQSSELSEEDMKLIKLIKALKEAGAL